VLVWAARAGAHARREARDGEARARLRFCAAFTLAPLAVFVAFSTRHLPKLNWTSPAWLATLPLIARWIADRTARADVRHPAWRGWAAAMVALFAGFAAWGSLDLAGLPAQQRHGLPLAWRSVAHEVGATVRAVEQDRGRTPLVSGLDRYNMSSELAYYGARGAFSARVTGRHVVGRDSLMWESWSPRSDALGRDVVFASFETRAVDDEHLAPWFERVGPVQERALAGPHGRLGSLFVRVGYGLRESAAPARPPLPTP
jgi:dolichol-phosphate mannosyltransferase